MDVTRIVAGIVLIASNYLLKRVKGLPPIVRGTGAKLLLYLGILIAISGFF